MDGVGFEILACTPLPQLPSDYPPTPPSQDNDKKYILSLQMQRQTNMAASSECCLQSSQLRSDDIIKS